MECEIDVSGSTPALVLKGKFTLESVVMLKNQLIAALDAHDEIELRDEGVLEGDLSFLQLCCAAHRSAVRRGKRLHFSGSGAGAVRAVSLEAGFQRHAPCPHGTREICLWTPVQPHE